MPSPFPGMDPYLEDSEHWRGVHSGLLFCIMENLQPRLLPRYVASTEGRLLLQPLDQPDPRLHPQPRLPDVTIKEHLSPRPIPDGGLLVAAPPVEATETLWIDEPELQFWQMYLEIRTVDDRSVVTVIEVLSPWNKSPGQGQEEYRRKQRELLTSEINLVEIDLLRAGAHTVAFRPGSIAPSDYRICTHRIDRPDGFAAVPFSVRDPLPRIAVPLRRGDPDVVLDLPTAFTRLYDTAAYAALVDYSRLPEPRLPTPDEAWTAELLRAAGLRDSESHADGPSDGEAGAPEPQP